MDRAKSSGMVQAIFRGVLQGLHGRAEPVSNGYTMGTKFVRTSSTRSAGTSLYCTVVWI